MIPERYNPLHYIRSMFEQEIYNPYDQKILVIEEVYDGESIPTRFEEELDRALELQFEIIVVIPHPLAEETTIWIWVGNTLYTFAVGSGLLSIISSIAHPKQVVIIPLTLISILCTSVYMASWQFDPCCKYQVKDYFDLTDRDVRRKLFGIFDDNARDPSKKMPAILVKQDDTMRKILQCTVTLLATILMTVRFFK